MSERITVDDARLTGYLLGELNASDRSAVVSAMASEPAIAESVSELRQTARELACALSREPEQGLADCQLLAIEQVLHELEAGGVGRRRSVGGAGRFWREPAFWVPVAAAAGFLLAVAWLAGATTWSTGGPVGVGVRPGGFSVSIELVDADASVQLTELPAIQSVVDRLAEQVGRPSVRRISGRLYASDAGSLSQSWQSQLTGQSDELLDYGRFVRADIEPVSTFELGASDRTLVQLRALRGRGERGGPELAHLESWLNQIDWPQSGSVDSSGVSVQAELGDCPWSVSDRLLRVQLDGPAEPRGPMPRMDYLLLIDGSGSMGWPNRWPMLRGVLQDWIGRLDRKSTVGVVVYAGDSSGLLLSPTLVGDGRLLSSALAQLHPGGSSLDGKAVTEALGLVSGRQVILLSDQPSRLLGSDLGPWWQDSVGFGVVDLSAGGGHRFAGLYWPVSDRSDAALALRAMGYGPDWPVAGHVDFQLEFRPDQVASYRLVGYGKRMMSRSDGSSSSGVSAGGIDLPAGRSFCGLYQLKPAGVPVGGSARASVSARIAGAGAMVASKPLATWTLRYVPASGDSAVVETGTILVDMPETDSLSMDFATVLGALALSMQHPESVSADLCDRLAAQLLDRSDMPTGMQSLITELWPGLSGR